VILEAVSGSIVRGLPAGMTVNVLKAARQDESRAPERTGSLIAA
jgi:hypothetical protein